MDVEKRPDLLEKVKRASGCFEVYEEVATYKGYRKRKDGSVKEVTIKVFDAGVGDPSRWHIVATDEDGRRAGGNHHESLDAVLAIVHWYDLDKE